MIRPDPWAGYDAETRARVAASDANLKGIILGRRAAARATLARDPRPAQMVYDDTAALLPGGMPVIQTGIPMWEAVPPGSNGGGPIAFTGEGPPTLEATVGAHVGDFYLDEISGDLYRLNV